MKRTLLLLAVVVFATAGFALCGTLTGVNANHKIALHVIPHGTTCETLPSFASCGDIHSTYAGTGDIDVIPVFYDLTEYTVIEFGLTWPVGWGVMDFTRCAADLAIGDIVNPGDGIAAAWTQCHYGWSVAAGYGWLNATGPGRISLVPNVTGDYGVVGCDVDQYVYDHPRGICNAGVGGTSGDDPCFTTEVYYPLNLNVGDGLTGGCTHRGDSLTYTLSFDNTTNSNPVHSVTLSDTLPQGTEFVSASAGGVYDAASHSVTWQIGTLASNATGSRSVRVAVDVDPPATITNMAGIVGDEVPATMAARNTNVCARLTYYALTLGKGAPAATCVYYEANVTYTLSYSNSPNAYAVSNALLVDSLPPQTEFVSATGGGVYDVNIHTVTWSLGTLAAKAAGSRQVTVKVMAPLNSSFTNVCHLTSTEAPPSNAHKTLTVCSSLYRSLGLTKTASASGGCAVPGADLTYTLSYSNAPNTRPVHTAYLTDCLPALTDFVSATGGGVYYDDARKVVWDIDSLAAGATGSRQVTVKVNVPLNSSFTNFCYLTSAETPIASANLTLRVCYPPGNNPLNKIAIHVKAHPTSCTQSYPAFNGCDAITWTYAGGGDIDIMPVFFDLAAYTQVEASVTWPEAAWGAGSWVRCKGDAAVGVLQHSADNSAEDPLTRGFAISWSACQNRWSAAPGYCWLHASTPARICPTPNPQTGDLGVLDCSARRDFPMMTFCAGVLGGYGDYPCGGPQGVQPTTWGSIKAIFK
jgi:uncharacterized repeat protein (TIGR01451 family)